MGAVGARFAKTPIAPPHINGWATRTFLRFILPPSSFILLLLMHIGFIGLGKMGGNMALRLTLGSPDGSVKGGHQVTGFAKDPNPELINVPGIRIVPTLNEMLAALPTPRVVWVMIPAGAPTESVITQLHEKLSSGDVVID